MCHVRADDQPQAQGSCTRLAARAALAEVAHPHRLSQHHLFRERRLWHPARRTDLLQHDGVEADAPSGSTAGRDPCRSLALRPGGESPNRAGPASGSTEDNARAGGDHGTRPQTCCARTPAAGRRRPPAGNSGTRALLRQLRKATADREVRHTQGFRRGARRSVDHRPAAAKTCKAGDRDGAQGAERPVGCARVHPTKDRRGGRDVRRRQLPSEPVQPCRPGRAAAGLVLQALRARHRAQAGHLAGDDVPVQAGPDLHRRPLLAGAQLRERLHRLGRPRNRDGGVGQQHLRAAHPPRGAGQRRADRSRARHHAAPESVLRHRARR